jgi:mannose-1-phosphate guanylyltransferase
MTEHCLKIKEKSVEAVREAKRDGVVLSLDKQAFHDCPSDSFDYAVMENTAHAAVVPADIGWSDVGSWAALWELAEKDESGNAVYGHVTAVDSENVYVRTDGPKVGVVGVKDLVIVVTGDAVLVSHRDEVQNVKTVVNALKDAGRHDLL